MSHESVASVRSLLPVAAVCLATLALDALAQVPAADPPAGGQPEAAEAPSETAGGRSQGERDEPEQLLELPPAPEALDGLQEATLEDPAPTTRLETLLELNRLAEEEQYEEALPLAEQLIELTEQEFGANSIEAAEAYQTAARVQRDAEEHQLAEQNYLHAVELIRNADGAFSARAIAPLIGLGDNYHLAGQYLNAITAYNEARTVNRRVFGLLNEGQVPILDKITQSFQKLQQYAEADEQQLAILHLYERNYEEGSPEYLEGIYRYASWLRDSGRYSEERSQYSRAMRIIRDHHGKESPLLVRALREIANSYRTQRLPENQGIGSLRSALEILDASGTDNPLARAEVLRDLGDWEVAFSKVDPDVTAYLEAWELLGRVENGDSLRRDWFGDLHNILEEPISQRGLSNDPDALSGHVIVKFGLDRFGRTTNVSVARSEPPGFKDEAVLRAVRRWRFRPFMENGQVVPREEVVLQFNYQYLPNETVE